MRNVEEVHKGRGRRSETPTPSKPSVGNQFEFALTWLKRHSTKATLEGMGRYAIPSGDAASAAGAAFTVRHLLVPSKN